MILCQQQKLNIHLIFQDQIENRSNSFLFVNATKIYQLKARDSEIKKCQLRLGNISEDFLANNLKKTKLNGCVYDLLITELLILVILSLFISI